MRAVALLVLVLALAPGCARHAERGLVVPLGIALAHGPTEASLAELVQTTRALGYELDFVDTEYGVFGARSRRPPSRGQEPVVFVVQCYADGRATLTVLGGRPLDRADRGRVPDVVRREAVALAQELGGGYAR